MTLDKAQALPHRAIDLTIPAGEDALFWARGTFVCVYKSSDNAAEFRLSLDDQRPSLVRAGDKRTVPAPGFSKGQLFNDSAAEVTVTLLAGFGDFDTQPNVSVSTAATLSGDLPDTAAGDLAAIVAALGGALTVNATIADPLPDTAADDFVHMRAHISDINAAVSALDNALQSNATDELRVDVLDVAQPPTVYSGQTAVTTAGTAVALAGATTLRAGCTIRAKTANVGNIYVGPSSVNDTNGHILAAGEVVYLEIDDLAEVYLDADNSADGVSYLAT